MEDRDKIWHQFRLRRFEINLCGVYLILGAKGVNWSTKTNQETPMHPSGEEVKAQLLAEAEAAIDRMLAKRNRQGAKTLTGIEQLTLDFRREMGEKVTQVLTEAAEVASVPGPTCPECGAEMHNKGRKWRGVVTRSGEINIERIYDYCEGRKQGFFPSG
jgi:hypothetical protein